MGQTPTRKTKKSSHAGTLVFCVFLVLFGSYIATRTAYNVKVEGAKGCDAIPHIDRLRGCALWCNGKVESCYGIERARALSSQSESYAHLVNNADAAL